MSSRIFLRKRGGHSTQSRVLIQCSVYMYLSVPNGFWSLRVMEVLGRIIKKYLGANDIQLKGLQKKVLCLSIDAGHKGRSGIAWGYTQFEALHTLQHLHKRLNQVGMTCWAGVKTNGTYKLFIQRSLWLYWSTHDVEGRSFIAFNQDLAFTLIYCL